MTTLDSLHFGLRWEFLSPWSEIRDYLQLTELVIAEAAEREMRALESATKGMTDEQRGEYLSNEARAYQIIKDEIPQFHRRGAYVTLISEWEREYREVAVDLLRVENKRRGAGASGGLRLDDFYGDVYEQARKVVTRLAGVADEDATWAILRMAVRIRNVLVHRAGRVSVQKADVDTKLSSALAHFGQRGLTVNDGGVIAIEPQCLEYLRATIETYMLSVIKACEEKYRSAVSST